jgi:hypothetical protein
MRYLTLLIASLFSSLSYADAYSYSCEINGEYTFGSDGKLVPAKQKIYLDQKFNVERKSGVVLGGGVGNSSYPTKTVIDIGGKEQAYKLIWISKEVVGTNGGRNAVYLSVEEYNEGDIKPFSMIVGSEVLSGVCQ